MDIDDYTQAQHDAIKSPDGNLQIVAGAGSGKTQVMAERVAELLGRGYSPSQVVAFTFTDRAAAELKDRIYRVVDERHGRLVGMAELFVGTMHAYCLNLLQQHLFRFLKYNVLNDTQVRLFIDRNSRKSGLTTVHVGAGPSEGQPLRRRWDTRLYINMLNILREDEIRPEHVREELFEALRTYQKLLHEHRYLDYSEILLAAVTAIESSAGQDEPLRRFLSETVRQVVVDEYQDLNPLQERLVAGLHRLGADIAVVGDDDQTIYQWRGSDIRGILTFQDRYDAVRQIFLTENFRSSDGVVEVGSRIAQRNDPNRLKKTMSSASQQGFTRGDILALTFRGPDEEADWISTRIRELRGMPFSDQEGDPQRGLSWSDFAILLRSVAKNGGPIVESLRRADIPFTIKGLNRLFESTEVRAAAQLFEFIVGGVEEDVVQAAWHEADVGLTDSDLAEGIAVLEEARDFDRGDRWGTYNIQRTFLSFLEAVTFREDRIPGRGNPRRSEIVLYNLGKFSQVISDFEQIHFQSDPTRKYESFVWWLRQDAPDHYEEGAVEEGFANPDTVQILTVHRAKGLEWPVVFVPALQRGRFPSRRPGGRNLWHILEREAISNPERYDGSEADETRLFYVAATRSKKYLYFTHAPERSVQFRRPSLLFTAVTGYTPVLTRPVDPVPTARVMPEPAAETYNIALSFSDLKYMFECPYQFKLRFLYGFNPPIHEALGYGKSVHDCLAEVHQRAMDSEILDATQAAGLVDVHLHVPFAYPSLRADLHRSAVNAVERYLAENRELLPNTEYAEKGIELSVGSGITIHGRVDLIRRIDTAELSIVDFKSTERAQDEDITRQQLHVYAIGYESLTGGQADLIEVLNLDQRGANVREIVDTNLLGRTKNVISAAAESLRKNDLPAHSQWCDSCARCDLVGICRTREE